LVACHDFEAVQALESHGNVDGGFVPDIDSTLALLLVVVFGEIVYQNSSYLSILAKEFVLAQYLLLAIFSRESDDVEQVWNDHSKLLEL